VKRAEAAVMGAGGGLAGFRQACAEVRRVGVFTNQFMMVAAAQPLKPGIARDADGKFIWRLDSKPCEKRKRPLRFSIEQPADLPVFGVD